MTNSKQFHFLGVYSRNASAKQLCKKYICLRHHNDWLLTDHPLISHLSTKTRQTTLSLSLTVFLIAHTRMTNTLNHTAKRRSKSLTLTLSQINATNQRRAHPIHAQTTIVTHVSVEKDREL